MHTTRKAGIMAFRKHAAVLGLIGLTLFTTSCAEKKVVEYQTDYLTYENVDALYDQADLVIEGTVSRPAKVQELQIGEQPTDIAVYTVFEVTIVETFKGATSRGKKIQVKQLGGTIGDT